MLRVLLEAICDGIFWGAGLAALVWGLQLLTGRTNAGTRHAVWCFTLAAVVLLPAFTVAARHSELAELSAVKRTTDGWCALLAFWTFGSLFMLARLVVSAVRLRRLVRAAMPLQSAGVPICFVPGRIVSDGGRRGLAVILLPAGLESRLTESEMEHVILHETAHIRRGDPWINLAGRVAEALFFFHPAVWWIGRQLRMECEIACDDWVVERTGEPWHYAASLTRLVELTVLRRAPMLATAALTGKRQISVRIERLLERGRNRSPHPAAFGISAAAVLIVAAMICCAQAPSVFAFSGWQKTQARSMNICRSNFWGSFTLKSRGDIEFADNDRDVKSISADGSLTIEEREGLTWHKLNFVERGGRIERTYSVNGVSESFDPDGRRWMDEILPRVIRETGVGAAARVERILRQGGASAVLAEISRIGNEGSKALYFVELTARTTDVELLRHILRQAMHEIDSDGERRRLLANLLNRGPLLPELLQAAARLRSDGEKAAFLTDALRYYPADAATRATFFKTVNTINSDGEKRRVLGALLRRPLDKDDMARVFQAAAKIASDGDKASVLMQGAGELVGAAGARLAWFHAVETINSDGEHRRVLEAALRRDAHDRDILLPIIRSATGMSSDGEKAAILSQVARVCPDDDAVVQAIVDSAQTLHSDGEYRRVITPLVRKGRNLRVIQKI